MKILTWNVNGRKGKQRIRPPESSPWTWTAGGYSFQTRRKEKVWRRRYDHVFASASLHPAVAEFLTGWLDEGWSDHASLMASFAPDVTMSGL